MRLSTTDERDDATSIATLTAALHAGVRFFDTADAYCRNAKDVGHNERLLAEALHEWAGDRSEITVATKGGMQRPNGRWVPNGRAKHIESACRASLGNLGSIDLYQLHAPDPRVSLKTTARALGRLKDQKLVSRIGLCNVSVAQLREVSAIVEVDAIQVAISPFDTGAVYNGIFEDCVNSSRALIVHSPLGSPKNVHRLRKNKVLGRIADEHSAPVEVVYLSWLRSFGRHITPIPGARTEEAARRCADHLDLAAEELVDLDAEFGMSRLMRTRRVERRPDATVGEEVVLLMGIQGSGKSTAVSALVDDGYLRLNRDEMKVTLRKLNKRLDEHLAAGARKVVLDNTYPGRAARSEVMEIAWRHGVAVRAIVMDTSLADAQVNVVHRIIEHHGRLLQPRELDAAGKKDPNTFGPRVQFRFRDSYEKPDSEEGFESIEFRAFERTKLAGNTHKAVIFECDGVLWESLSGERAPKTAADLRVPPVVVEVVRQLAQDGFRILGVSWRPDLKSDDVRDATMAEIISTARELLGVELDVEVCAHPAGPPICWCRRPLPGSGVVLVRRHKLDPSQCLVVGKGAADKSFAASLGMSYEAAPSFFESRSAR